MQVAPTTGAWIETSPVSLYILFNQSLPPRERGLKLSVILVTSYCIKVAPTTGAWIETA